MVNNNLAILFGLCLILTACDSEPAVAPTSPDPQAGGARALAAAAANAWTEKSDLRIPRSQVKAAALDNLIYVVGGRTSSNTASASLQLYNIATDRWSPLEPMPGARFAVSGVSVINSRLYVSGGFDSRFAPVKTLLVYDPMTDSWVRKADLPRPGACGAQGVISAKLYAYIGCPKEGEDDRLFRYDPATDSWVTLAAPPSQHSSPAAAGVINGKLYLAGGSANFQPNLALHVYDPATDTWTSRAPLPGAQLASATGVLGGKLYAAGGEDERSLAIATLRVYSPGSNTWATSAPMPTARYETAGAVASGMLFVIGGWPRSGPPIASEQNEAYTP